MLIGKGLFETFNLSSHDQGGKLLIGSAICALSRQRTIAYCWKQLLNWIKPFPFTEI